MAEFRSALEEKQDAGSRTVALAEGLFANELSAEETEKLINESRRQGPDDFYNESNNDAFQLANAEPATEEFVDYSYDYTAQTEGDGASVNSQSRNNPLDEYANYSYGITLSYLNLTKYNEIVLNGEDFIASDGEVLVSSAGRRNDYDMVRNEYFSNDMYFESLKMLTVIGYNSRTRGSNVVEINFTIVEPYSIKFLDNILRIANKEGIRAWDQMPFVLKVDFFANTTEDGPLNDPIVELGKRICIKIIDIRIKLTHKGTEYYCTAIPMSHVALLQTVGTVPITLEVKAKNVKDYFDSQGDPGNVGDPIREPRQTDNEELGFSVTETTERDRSVSQTNSLPAALNKWQKRLVEKNHQKVADEYNFVIDDEIANATIVYKGGTPFRNLPSDSDKIDYDTLVDKINAGASIIDVINDVVYASTFYQDQLKSDSKTVDNVPMKAHKILTTIEYGPEEYDEIRKQYKKIITYYVKSVKYYNQKSPHIKRSTPDFVNKEYNYMYTGQNQQILDLQIDFNTMFYTAITALELKDEKASAHQPNRESIKDSIKKDKLDPGESDKIDPLKINPVSSQPGNAKQKNLNRKSIEAGDLQESMMSNSRGDMINVKLKIHGDPDLIKQDEVYYPPGYGSGTSIVMDAGEIFAHLFFKTPEDLDQEVGLYEGIYNYEENNQNSFSGKYKIITVDNVFERGQFVQILDMIRLFEQDNRDSNENSNRESEGLGVDLGAFNEAVTDQPGEISEDFIFDEYGEGGEYIEVGGELVPEDTFRQDAESFDVRNIDF